MSRVSPGSLGMTISVSTPNLPIMELPELWNMRCLVVQNSKWCCCLLSFLLAGVTGGASPLLRGTLWVCSLQSLILPGCSRMLTAEEVTAGAAGNKSVPRRRPGVVQTTCSAWVTSGLSPALKRKIHSAICGPQVPHLWIQLKDTLKKFCISTECVQTSWGHYSLHNITTFFFFFK
jgi:hypothetical protein